MLGFIPMHFPITILGSLAIKGSISQPQPDSAQSLYQLIVGFPKYSMEPYSMVFPPAPHGQTS